MTDHNHYDLAPEYHEHMLTQVAGAAAADHDHDDRYALEWHDHDDRYVTGGELSALARKVELIDQTLARHDMRLDALERAFHALHEMLGLPERKPSAPADADDQADELGETSR
jgi:hypothetical protein